MPAENADALFKTEMEACNWWGASADTWYDGLSESSSEELGDGLEAQEQPKHQKEQGRRLLQTLPGGCPSFEDDDLVLGGIGEDTLLNCEDKGGLCYCYGRLLDELETWMKDNSPIRYTNAYPKYVSFAVNETNAGSVGIEATQWAAIKSIRPWLTHGSSHSHPNGNCLETACGVDSPYKM